MLALCLREVLISSPDTWYWTRMHVLAVMHRRTLCENVDSAKIKVFFYYRYRHFRRGIDASYRHTFSRRFYPKRLTVHSGYTFYQYVCSLGIEPTTFVLLTQCSNPVPQEHSYIVSIYWSISMNRYTPS